ncbi:hypothetical protein ACFFP0_19330 [Rhizobium puerariae]|uniref:Uncharacterized protein n=1 Tax=Rhizobium puerariae TaxID=1585791 RepID=A0ABV6AK46_9HYPH
MIALALTAAPLVPSQLAFAMTESDYRDRFCAGMETEIVLPNGTRVDCMNSEIAVEVDFSSKWGEGIGQALSYAATTGRRPGVILICRNKQGSCLRHSLLLEEAAAHWKLPITIWLCLPTDGALAQCSRKDY